MAKVLRFLLVAVHLEMLGGVELHIVLDTEVGANVVPCSRMTVMRLPVS